jgi:acyl-CoA thioesterase FadM
VEKIGNSSIHFYQEIKKEDNTLVKAKTVWACIGKDFKAQAVPQEIKASLLA